MGWGFCRLCCACAGVLCAGKQQEGRCVGPWTPAAALHGFAAAAALQHRAWVHRSGRREGFLSRRCCLLGLGGCSVLLMWVAGAFWPLADRCWMQLLTLGLLRGHLLCWQVFWRLLHLHETVDTYVASSNRISSWIFEHLQPTPLVGGEGCVGALHQPQIVKEDAICSRSGCLHAGTGLPAVLQTAAVGATYWLLPKHARVHILKEKPSTTYLCSSSTTAALRSTWSLVPVNQAQESRSTCPVGPESQPLSAESRLCQASACGARCMDPC